VLEEQLLGSHHERAAFVSGVPALDQFLLQYAAQQAKKGVTTVRVLVDSNASHEIIGYYTLSAAQVDAANLPPELQKKLPRYPVPCFRMGRLAVHIGARGKGYGAMLLALAVERCQEARKHVAGYALIVDAKDDHAKAFYAHHGFVSLAGQPLSLYIPLGRIEA
jgi:predicted GNAT family N-acyltransferase